MGNIQASTTIDRMSCQRRICARFAVRETGKVPPGTCRVRYNPAEPRYSDWPLWLQVLVVAPHGLLLSAAFWLWWPKSDKDRKKFGIVVSYLLFFVAVMHLV